jgi:hypothetical protein
MRDPLHRARHAPLHAGAIALGFQQRNDVERGPVAKELPERLFVPGYAVAFNQLDKVARRIPRQRRPAEIGVLRQIVRRLGVKIGEVAAPAAGNADLLPKLVVMLDQQDAPSAATGDGRAHHSGAPAPMTMTS